MQSCQNRCPKLRGKVEPDEAELDTVSVSSHTGQKRVIDGRISKSIISNRRSPSQSQKSVQIGGVTAVEIIDSFQQELRETKSSNKGTSTPDSRSTSGRETSSGSTRSSPQIGITNNVNSSTRSVASDRKVSPQKSPPSTNYNKMSSNNGAASATSRAKNAEWNSTSHDPCPPSCPMTMARDLAARKAEARQERLDDYLLNKGFRYFDDLCTCSPICLFNQLRRDKFVKDMIKSACLFVLGMKLCEELDALNLIE